MNEMELPKIDILSPHIKKEIAPEAEILEIPNSINKVKKILIKGILKHDSTPDKQPQTQ